MRELIHLYGLPLSKDKEGTGHAVMAAGRILCGPRSWDAACALWRYALLSCETLKKGHVSSHKGGYNRCQDGCG